MPPAVYWRRRVMVLGVVLLLIFLLAKACTGGDSESRVSDARDSSPTPSPQAVDPVPAGVPVSPGSSDGLQDKGSDRSSDSGGKSPDTADAQGVGQPVPSTPTLSPDPELCRPGDIKVTVQTDKRQYAPGVNPFFTLTVENVGQSACRLWVGGDTTELVVTSGTDRIWSSEDCRQGGQAELERFEPGVPVTLRHVIWQRVRSKPGCPTGSPQLARPGTYVVTGSVRGLQPARAVFELR
ncbi:hypothetical protein [Carbonactinospora thermoautotrophica]|uniref:hypothetical protein n=1 Tax=Carbonactinospora thermoautotrophica TaxID=1469144 RepID=UPI00226EE31F|nr:hypothetical protein [Carbonactinospora thermoautotrophica]